MSLILPSFVCIFRLLLAPSDQTVLQTLTILLSERKLNMYMYNLFVVVIAKMENKQTLVLVNQGSQVRFPASPSLSDET